MEAPNKIFLPRNIDCPSAAILTLGNQPGDVEYIRKDALLEWLESKVYEHNEDRFDDGFNAALGQVIDKINSL